VAQLRLLIMLEPLLKPSVWSLRLLNVLGAVLYMLENSGSCASGAEDWPRYEGSIPMVAAED
jgi:hypothetical protein